MEKFTICVLGDFGVGKTSLIKSYTQDSISHESPLNVFASFYHSSILEWWDFSGNPKYASLRKLFCKYFHGYVLVFDLSNKKSFKRMQKWETEINQWTCNTDAPVLRVGTKEDLGVTGSFPIEFTKATKGAVDEDDWEKFLARVISTDTCRIQNLNQELEDTKAQESETLITRLHKWCKPLLLPLNKGS